MILAGIFFIVGAWVGGAIGFICGYKFVIDELKQKRQERTAQEKQLCIEL